MKKLTSISCIVSVFLSLLFVDTYAQTFETGKIAVGLSNAGRVRIFAPNSSTRQIDRFSFLVGVNGENPIFDYYNDADSMQAAKTITPATFGDYEVFSRIDNRESNAYPYFEIQINAFGWNNSGYALLKATITNKESSTKLIYPGFEIIPQVDGAYGFETLHYSQSGIKKYLEIFKAPTSTYTGIQILDFDITNLKLQEWYSGYNYVDDSLSFWANRRNIIDTLYDSGSDGSANIGGCNTYSLGSNESVTLYVLFAVGPNKNEMLLNLDSAYAKYLNYTSDITDYNNTIPDNYSLSQNYPNPFNPSTKISFDLPTSDFVTLKVYNSLGQEVSELVNSFLPAGNYTYTFDAENLSSGVYFYQLKSGNYFETKKMILMK